MLTQLSLWLRQNRTTQRNIAHWSQLLMRQFSEDGRNKKKPRERTVLISGCLLGQRVRYDGGDMQQPHQRLQEYVNNGKVVSICPEVVGGLPTPRDPSEIEPGKTAQDVIEGKARVLSIHGADVTDNFLSGAKKALALAQKHNIKVAILTEESPSCGRFKAHNGKFIGEVIPGMGTTSALLLKNGISVFNEYQIDEALDEADTIESRLSNN